MFAVAKAAKAARAEIVRKIADDFQASGEQYTCGAVIMTFAASRITEAVSNLPPAVLTHRHMSFNKIKRDVWDEIHNREHVR